MGFFKSTCALSGLPISSGLVYLTLVIETTEVGVWQPLCVPFKGKFDDYGWVEEDPEFSVSRDGMYRSGEPFTGEWRDVCGYFPVHKGNLTVSAAMIREDVWEATLKAGEHLRADSDANWRNIVWMATLLGRPPSFEKIGPRFSDFFLISAMMAKLNRHWKPSVANGSQNTDLKLHKKMLKAYRNIAKEMHKEEKSYG